MQSRERFPLERIDEIVKHPENFRLLERIPFTQEGILDKLPLKLHEPQEGDTIKYAVFLDTETTGTDCNSDSIIELGMVRCSYSFERRVILSIEKYYDELEDPGKPIPPKVQELTGINDAMVAGKSFDSDLVGQMLAGRPLIIAHNAHFDRPFFDRRFPSLNNLAWACSYVGINWDALGNSGKKLEYLTQARGWFYSAHRAYSDCLALIWLMHLEPEAFDMLIGSALRCDYRLLAWGSPFKVKDELKAQEYRFDGSKRVWYKNFPSKAEAQQALHQLSALFDVRSCEIITLNAATRFKT